MLPIGFISATVTKECLRMTAEQMFRWPSLLWGYFRVLRRRRPGKIIHTNWQHLLLVLPFLRAERDVFWLHEYVPDRPQYRRVFAWFQHERRIGLFRLRVARSGALATRARYLWKRKSELFTTDFRIADRPRTSWRIRAIICRIGIVGQIAPWKGHDFDLIEAFALVCRKHFRPDAAYFRNRRSGLSGPARAENH